MKIIVSASVLFFLLSPVLSYGQDGEKSSLERINAIKKQGDHIFAEYTSADINESRKNAIDILSLNIESFLQEQPSSTDFSKSIDNIIKSHEEIVSRRGEMYRVFIYIPKQTLYLPAIPSDTKRNESSLESHDVPKQTLSSSAISSDTKRNESSSESPNLTDEENRILSVLKFSEIEQFIITLSSAGMIDEYGKYSTLPKDEPCYIFVYDKTGAIVAWLKQSSSIQTNLKTGNEDDVRKYKSCGCIWFHLKNM